jgi:hypothetical protein
MMTELLKTLLSGSVGLGLLGSSAMATTPKEDENALALAASMTAAYSKCGGQVSPDMWALIAPYRRHPLTLLLEQKIKQERTPCSFFKNNYAVAQEAARRATANQEARKQAQPDFRSDPNSKPSTGFPVRNVNGAALLAEYVATCGPGKPTEAAVRDAMSVVDEMGFKKWLDHVSWVHLVRDKEQERQFCESALKVLGSAISTQQSDIERSLPEELTVLSQLTRRLVYCSVKGGGLFATMNKEACQ